MGASCEIAFASRAHLSLLDARTYLARHEVSHVDVELPAALPIDGGANRPVQGLDEEALRDLYRVAREPLGAAEEAAEQAQEAREDHALVHGRGEPIWLN